MNRIESNKNRDFLNKVKLIKLGWKVIDLWECTLKKREINKTFLQLERIMGLPKLCRGSS